MSKLTAKQLRFCEEYLIDGNSSAAAVRAGYSPKTSDTIGSQNLRKLEIEAKIAELRETQQERTQITADQVVERLWKIVNFDIRSIIVWSEYIGFDFKPIEDWSDDARSIMIVSGTTNSGKPKFRAESRLSALESLGKHYGMFDNFNTAIACLKTYNINIVRDENNEWIIKNN